MTKSTPATQYQALQAALGDAVQYNVPMAGFTTARTGGPADVLVTAGSAEMLAQAARVLWEQHIPFSVLGYGSNVLVSDQGVRGAVLLNRARAIQMDRETGSIWAESGAMIGTIARQAALHGLSGMEWAASVPGTLGGAIYGNAGAHGSDMAASLGLAEILQPEGSARWNVQQLEYGYRTSALKRMRGAGSFVILAGQLLLTHSSPEQVQQVMERNRAHRRATQPPGASMGSMFKNPPGDHAGRLIDAAGLKGTRVGSAEISTVHANFFINHGGASAEEIGRLIALARRTVVEKFGVRLDLEIELLGEWTIFDQEEA